MNRRDFLQALSIAAGGLAIPGCAPSSGWIAGAGAVDRRARVARHSPVIRSFDPWAPLSVGNGGFAFTADATGLQTFPAAYRELPLATQAEWGWHSFPNPSGFRLADALEEYDAHGRMVPYASRQSGPAGSWLRENPHRLSLARVGLDLRRPDGAPALPADLADVEQRLDLWTGTIDSRFTHAERPVRVRSWAHPDRDLLAVRVEAAGIPADRLALLVAFAYGAAVHSGDPSDWTQPAEHRTDLANRSATGATWRRTLDETRYAARGAWSPNLRLVQTGPHFYRLEPVGDGPLELVIDFSRAENGGALPSVDEVRAASEAHWESFWSEGGVLDLSDSTDPRAPELERRIVLSEYLTAIQCAGTIPPQETGETFNSWFGKFHLEMHWWHAAHFSLWGRTPLLERSFPWYRSVLAKARETARMQGYAGARWPKMVGPAGRESPSGVGVFLIWQQPHPIYLAELAYLARPERRLLDEMAEVVFATADFMASYPFWDERTSRYILGPPLIPAQELHPARTTFNPTFELAYWEWGLRTAQEWRRRLGLPPKPEWERVASRLSPLPMRDGLYLNAESDPETWTKVEQRRDHPTVLGAYGFVASPRVDREAMRRTLHRVMSDWQWPETWGWDYGLTALTAARLGEPEIAVDALLLDTPKNRYLPNGHNYQRPGLSIYLPGNGALLAASAHMAASGSGFPRNGWRPRWEGLRQLP
jgi:hypothetical protein